jgi:hypothetical protein
MLVPPGPGIQSLTKISVGYHFAALMAGIFGKKKKKKIPAVERDSAHLQFYRLLVLLFLRRKPEIKNGQYVLNIDT